MGEDEDSGEAESTADRLVVAGPDSVFKNDGHKTVVEAVAYHPPIHEWQHANFK